MIRVFKKKRYTIVENNKTTNPSSRASKYLKYAIGEIVLVMIGILLALQVNNWNQYRIEEKEEKEILNKLQQDFRNNKIIIQNYIISDKNEMNAGSKLMSLIGSSREALFEHNLDSLFFETFNSNELAFADNTIKSIMQSGKLNQLKNKKLTELLYQWNTLSEIKSSRIEKLDNWANNQFLPYLLTKISFKEMDANGNLPWSGTSKVKPDYYSLFQEVEFENYLDNTLWFHLQIQKRCAEIDEIIDQIITATAPKLK